MFNKILIIGMGEVGRAHFNVLRKVYADNIYTKDKGPDIYDSNGNIYYDNQHKGFDLLLIATQCNPDNMGEFHNMVWGYIGAYQPKHVDILTTCPPLTCEAIAERLEGISVTKSTIRGMHGNGVGLETFLYDIPKHIGGPNAAEICKFYEKAGIECHAHNKARATELFHILNNSDYGIAIAKAQENYDLCRHFAVSYVEWMEYKKTNNSGFLKAGYPDKMSAILTPPNGPIKGHCVVYSSTTIQPKHRGPLMSILAEYNDKDRAPIKQDTN